MVFAKWKLIVEIRLNVFLQTTLTINVVGMFAIIATLVAVVNNLLSGRMYMRIF